LTNCSQVKEESTKNLNNQNVVSKDTLNQSETSKVSTITSRQQLLDGLRALHPETELHVDTNSRKSRIQKALETLFDYQIKDTTMRISAYNFLEFHDQNTCDSVFLRIKELTDRKEHPDILSNETFHDLYPKTGIIYLKLNEFIGFRILSCRYTTRSYNQLKEELMKYETEFENSNFFIVKCGATGTLFK